MSIPYIVMLRILFFFFTTVLFAQEVNFTAKTQLQKTIQFYDASTDVVASEWLWSFGDGTTSTEQNPVHTYTSSGLYEVCLTVNDTYSLCKNNVFKVTDNGVIVKFDDTQWPNGEVSILSSPFGPRYKLSEDRYDYHRGIDIPGDNGDPVYNIADGIVYNVYEEGEEDSPYSSTVVIVKHEMETPIYFHGKFITTYYSLSMHLNEISNGIVKNAVVARGVQIGTVGQTGPTTFDHNHFEIRLGVICSKESQENGFCQFNNPYDEPTDPHVNPLLFLDYENHNTNSLQCNVLSTSPLTVEVISDRPELDFNTIKVAHNGEEKVFDLNERIGVDPDDIDNDVYDSLEIDPDEFTSQGGQDYRLELTFDAFEEVDEIEVTDIWGNRGAFTNNVVLGEESKTIIDKGVKLIEGGFLLKNFEIKNYELYNLSGQLLEKSTVTNNQVYYKVQLKPGYYLLNIYENDGKLNTVKFQVY